MATITVRHFSEIDPLTAYGLWRLRGDVFVVEQNCPYADLDGRDTESGTLHIWSTIDERPVAYLRVLSESDGYRIGRVCTHIDWRRRGLADELLTVAAKHTGDSPVVLDAQTTATALYLRHGFRICGPEFLDDGIPHVPMSTQRTESA